MPARAERSALVAAAYVGAMAAYVYAVLDPSLTYGSDARDAIVVAALSLLHFGTGWMIGRWWVVLLPILVVPIALPAGYADRGELEVWTGIAYVVAPLGVAVVGLGAALRSLGPRVSRQPTRL